MQGPADDQLALSSQNLNQAAKCRSTASLQSLVLEQAVRASWLLEHCCEPLVTAASWEPLVTAVAWGILATEAAS